MSLLRQEAGELLECFDVRPSCGACGLSPCPCSSSPRCYATLVRTNQKHFAPLMRVRPNIYLRQTRITNVRRETRVRRAAINELIFVVREWQRARAYLILKICDVTGSQTKTLGSDFLISRKKISASLISFSWICLLVIQNAIRYTTEF